MLMKVEVVLLYKKIIWKFLLSLINNKYKINTTGSSENNKNIYLQSVYNNNKIFIFLINRFMI